MASGPEHYREAERLLARRPDADGRPDRNPPWEIDVAQAQVHALLSLAAATALGGWTESGMPQPDRKDWWRAASGEPAERRRIKEARAAEFAEFEEAQA